MQVWLEGNNIDLVNRFQLLRFVDEPLLQLGPGTYKNKIIIKPNCMIMADVSMDHWLIIHNNYILTY